MKIKPFIIVLILVGLIGLALWTSKQEAQPKDRNASRGTFSAVEENGHTGLKPGNKVPDFTIMALNGEKVSIKDYRGKKVILNFWATWCPPCRKEMPDMQKVFNQYEEKKLEILAVNLRYTEKSTDSVSEFVKERKAAFPILLDTDGTVSKKFQAVSLPTSYLIDSKGIIQKKIIGPLSQNLMIDFAEKAK
ncbi:TlpA disulfide reductase family protein [Fictibacillus sp. KU28468]|uniref:TlpA disulfide reductase family protein n=1 Tax=Fictibacillus sp. KU28468 TaxID=2991053 RepID=UPI00223DD404|nr:TlpA disulfide reductase family protein [Fictibacillus sp. KU28468]UZJ78132.1 TlpA family protein disulfide reductase [Fictibacillus sp. KU28468]